MILFHDPRCIDYGAPGHPERPERITQTAAHLKAAHPSWAWQAPSDSVTDDVLLLAHTPAHLARLETPNDFDPDTAFFPGIAGHARRSVAAALSAARHAATHHTPAFAFMRPPGHHATADRAMGFCYLNQIAIAALFAQRELGAAKVAIWDFDAHHCNGTESILHGRKGTLVCSVHQSHGYPGTGLRDWDNSRNWPVPPGCTRERHRDALCAALDAAVAFTPDLLLVSAGFDAYARDPITEMSLEAEDFAALGEWLRRTGLPSAAVLEGGYSPDLPLLIDAFLSAWEG